MPGNGAAYASVDDLEARWRPLTDAESARAAVLLADASVFLDNAVERYGIDVEARSGALRIVCCDLVQRKMESGGALPLKSETQQAGPYSVTATYAVATRKFRLYPEDLDILGVSGGGAGCFWMGGGDG